MAVAVHSSSASYANASWSPLPAVQRTTDTVKQAATQAASLTAQGASKVQHATCTTVCEAGRFSKLAALSVGKFGHAAALSVGDLGKAATKTLLRPLEHHGAPVPASKAAATPSDSQLKAAKLLASLRLDDAADGDVEDLERQVIQHQRERRRVWYHNAGQGFRTGVCLGAACGWIPAVALIPTTGASSLLLWPASMAGIGVAGATIGATGKFHFSPARPDDVRKHIFERFGVVPTRRESAVLVAKLQSAGALSHSRFRKLVALEPAAQVLTTADLGLAQQRRALRILQIIEKESARRAPLLREANILWQEIEALQRKPQQERTPEDQSRIQMLIAAAALMNTRLAWLKPAVPATAVAPVAPSAGSAAAKVKSA